MRAPATPRTSTKSPFALATAFALVASCDHDPVQAPIVDAAGTHAAARDVAHDAPAGGSGPPAVVDAGFPVDPGNFARFGCATDAAPPYLRAGRATVTWRPDRGGGAFNFRNVPARCGAAFPGQFIGATRSRPGDGAEFVVCMPDERRLDLGILRRGAIPAGPVDVGHTENLVRLRIGLDRFVHVVATGGVPDAGASDHVEFGRGLRSARGSVRLTPSAEGAAGGLVAFEIDCSTGARTE